MEQLQKNKFLGEEKISKLLVKFSIPCIFSLLISALYNMVDQIFIGNSELGYIGNAATGVVFPIIVITQAFAWGIGDGCAAYLSICQGKNDTQNSHKCIGTGITLTVIVSIVLLVVGNIIKEPLLRLFGASDQSIGMAVEYFTIMSAFFPAYMIFNMINGIIRADGSPAFAMISIVAGAVTNLILDPVFIFACNWGISGAAWATVIGQTLSFVISAAYLLKSKTFKLKPNSFIPNFNIFRHSLKLGISSFVTQISVVIISTVCNIMLYRYGELSVYGPDIPISVISIESKVFIIVLDIVVGIIVGAQPMLGYNYGAKKYSRVKETYKKVLLLTVIIGLISTFVFEVFPEAVVGIFGEGDTLYNEFASITLRVFLSLTTFTCIMKMTSIFFQSVGKPVSSILVSLIRDIVCFLPLIVILPSVFENNKSGTGIYGILIASPISDIISIIVTACIVVPYLKSLKTEGKVLEIGAISVAAGIKKSKPGVIVTINREHGTMGKQIGKLVAEKLGVPFYCKELMALAAQESGFDKEFISDINIKSPSIFQDLYLSTNVVQQAICAQEKIIKKIADSGSCVIVGRASDYVLSGYDNVIKIFIHAPIEYRIKNVMSMYGEDYSKAESSVKHSDSARTAYYKNVSGEDWHNYRNYDFNINSEIGVEKTAEVICEYIKSSDK